MSHPFLFIYFFLSRVIPKNMCAQTQALSLGIYMLHNWEEQHQSNGSYKNPDESPRD